METPTPPTPVITAQERRELIRSANANEQFTRGLQHLLNGLDDTEMVEAIQNTVSLMLAASIELNVLAHQLIARGAQPVDIEAIISASGVAIEIDIDEMFAASDAVAAALVDFDC